jgi:hypothetical protein
VPLIKHVFGLSPDAHHQAITFSPHLPSTWDHMKISALPIGNNTISFTVKKTGSGFVYSISSERADWNFRLQLKGLRGTKYVLNGKAIIAASDEIQVHGKANDIMVPAVN